MLESATEALTYIGPSTARLWHGDVVRVIRYIPAMSCLDKDKNVIPFRLDADRVLYDAVLVETEEDDVYEVRRRRYMLPRSWFRR